jgi:hypothetical protein
MFKAIRMVLILIGLLPHAVVHADGTTSRDWSPALSTTLTDSVPLPAYESPPPTRSFTSSFDKLHFQDSSAVGRASKLRSLSLLTLAEFRKSRVFLGVNNRGVLGLHFNMARKGDDRCLEVARMPYLRNKTSD